MTKTPASINWIIVATSFGFVVSQLDVTIVNVALASMATGLQASVAGLQWVVDAYALLFASLLLSAGALGDRLGARRLYIAGFVLFAAASLVSVCPISGNLFLMFIKFLMLASTAFSASYLWVRVTNG